MRRRPLDRGKARTTEVLGYAKITPDRGDCVLRRALVSGKTQTDFCVVCGGLMPVKRNTRKTCSGARRKAKERGELPTI